MHDGLLFDKLQGADALSHRDDQYVRDHAQVYEISNVSEYFFAVASDEYWPSSRFPCCTPPAPVVWIESRQPSGINSVVHGKQRWTGPEQWGLLLLTTDLLAYYKDKPTPWIWSEKDGRLTMTIPETARWLVISVGFFRFGSSIRNAGVGRMILDGEGRILKFHAEAGDAPALARGKQEGEWVVSHEPHEWFYTAHHDIVAGAERAGVSEGEAIKALSQELRRLSEPVWLALSFLHCSNTIVDEGKHPRPVRRRALREQRALATFKVLRVEPITRVVAGERTASTATEPGHVALHIRRGGFRDYREGKGLFGKIHKLVWYEQMVVGSSKAGTVTKTYEVSP